MSRDNGFTVADTATGLHHDPKVKKLWRILRDADRMSEAMACSKASAWQAGPRATASTLTMAHRSG